MGWWEDFKNALACKSSAQERCENVSCEYILEGVMLKKNGEYLPFNRVSVKKVISKYFDLVKKHQDNYDLLVWKDYKVDIESKHWKKVEINSKDNLDFSLDFYSCDKYIKIYDLTNIYGDKIFKCKFESYMFVSTSYLYRERRVDVESKYLDSKDGAFKLLQDFIDNCTPVATPKFLIRKKFKELNKQRTESEWMSINNGEYYTNSDYWSYLYRFSDWSSINNEEEIYNIVKDANIEICDDPKKTHWKHFQHLEMLKKKERDKQVKEYVDSVLNKQQEYNDLQLLYEATISAPIIDVDSFRNFCKIVYEDKKFEDYEIANYLMLLGKCKH